ncbi:YwmB family TATA-box binding protein [Risungbinella massiliensis]|uniref:YwmB family TATA-box binding protein n=1 Tax=Risungbinella massiliensis TaxID=1329796 RepID=UPI0005CBBAA7|nr:YwmB family TATA-box binding protein [Risungbinella massiliensis]
MKKRTTILFACGWLVISLVLLGSRFTTKTNEEILVEIASNLSLEAKQTQYHFSGRTKQQMAAKDVDRFVTDLANHLSLSSVQKDVDLDGIRYQAEKRSLNKHYQLQIVQDRPKADFVQPYVVLSIQETGTPDPQWLFIKEDLQSLLLSFGLILDYHVSYQWESKRELELQGTINQILNLLDAKQVEGMVTKRTLAVSAQSPLLTGQLATGKSWMNVQVAARYSDDQSKTIVTIGTPIITMEY